MSASPQRDRIAIFDTVRGFTIISMIAFHTCYDLAYLKGLSLPWFTGTLFQDLWRASISWIFLLLAGWMTTFSRNNLRRGLVYASAAAVVFTATFLTRVDTPVTFGILFCMAASTLLVWVSAPVLSKTDSKVLLAISLVLFALTYNIPHTRYDIAGLAWLGLPSPTFASGDYYPLLPYFFMYLAGSALAGVVKTRLHGEYPAWTKRDWLPPLSAIGRLSLPIYLLHQPLILLALQLM